jgi:hypothetical protein
MNVEHDLRLELSLPSEWDRIEQVREAVTSSLGAVFGSGGVDELLSMVSTELLENAMKYGTPGESVRFSLHSQLDTVTVSVSNHVRSDSEHARTLAKHIAWLESFGDAREAYAAALQRVYSTMGGDHNSGLGIARIFHEGQCSVACEHPTPEILTVTARWAGSNVGA